MGLTEFVTSAFIVLGAAVMLLSVIGTRRVLALLDQSQHLRAWRTLFFLMLFFTAGYVFALAAVWAGLRDLLVALTGIIFFFGALFVFLVVRTGFLTIQELAKSKSSATKSRDQAIEAYRLKSELLARVSHELRTPLHAILGYADILQTGDYGRLSEQQQQAMSRIRLNTEKLIDQVNDLLKQARIEAGRVKLNKKPFRPAALLKDVDSTLRPLAVQKNLDFSGIVAENMPPVMLGDEERLQEIMMNLGGNAIKFTDKGSIKIRLLVPEPGQWAIQVSDTGLGIPVQDQPYIFDPFRQVDGSATRDRGGSGLGLSIARQMTELMGGKIEVDSELGKGSTFLVQLPMVEMQEAI